MLLIQWSVAHKNHTNPIELCGWYDSLEHFWRVQSVDDWRGWKVVRQPVILVQK